MKKRERAVNVWEKSYSPSVSNDGGSTSQDSVSEGQGDMVSREGVGYLGTLVSPGFPIQILVGPVG